jgi:hypothetical protein
MYGHGRLGDRNFPVNVDGLRRKRKRKGDHTLHDAVITYARRVNIATMAAKLVETER